MSVADILCIHHKLQDINPVNQFLPYLMYDICIVSVYGIPDSYC